MMNNKYFDEKSIAEEMAAKQSFIKCYSVGELAIYGKWLKYKRLVAMDQDGQYNFDIPGDVNDRINSEIESELIDFAQKHYGAFNYNNNYQDIDRAMEIVRKYKLKLPRPLPITKNEVATLKNIQNDTYRRILFGMLVSAKYYAVYNSSIEKEVENIEEKRHYVQMTDYEIFSSMKVKFENKDEKAKVWNCMKKDLPEGLCMISSGKYNNRYIGFIDFSVGENENPVDYVTDYNHLYLHYDKIFSGVNYSACIYCGRLYKPNAKNNTSFCSKHRGYVKNADFRVCEKCGGVFYTSHSGRKLCDKCRNHEKYERRKIQP